MKEELNIDIEIKKFLGFGEDTVKIGNKRVSRVILYFLAKRISGNLKIQAKKEISKIKWTTGSSIKKIQNLKPAMKNLFKKSKLIL